MLISQKDILESNPPFLMDLSNNTWQLVEQIALIEEQYHLTIIDKNDEGFFKRVMHLDEKPFHIGVGVWELDYGSTLMTLDHASLAEHPAKNMWQEYLRNSQ